MGIDLRANCACILMNVFGLSVSELSCVDEGSLVTGRTKQELPSTNRTLVTAIGFGMLEFGGVMCADIRMNKHCSIVLMPCHQICNHH